MAETEGELLRRAAGELFKEKEAAAVKSFIVPAYNEGEKFNEHRGVRFMLSDGRVVAESMLDSIQTEQAKKLMAGWGFEWPPGDVAMIGRQGPSSTN